MNKHNIIKKGTIYKISSDKTDMIYIGCTSNDIKKRFSVHKSHFKIWKNGNAGYQTCMNKIFDLGGNVKIEKISEHHNIEKKKLLCLEMDLILNTPNTINIIRRYPVH